MCGIMNKNYRFIYLICSVFLIAFFVLFAGEISSTSFSTWKSLIMRVRGEDQIVEGLEEKSGEVGSLNDDLSTEEPNIPVQEEEINDTKDLNTSTTQEEINVIDEEILEKETLDVPEEGILDQSKDLDVVEETPDVLLLDAEVSKEATGAIDELSVTETPVINSNSVGIQTLFSDYLLYLSVNIVNENGGVVTVKDLDIRLNDTSLISSFDEGTQEGDVMKYNLTYGLYEGTNYMLTSSNVPGYTMTGPNRFNYIDDSPVSIPFSSTTGKDIFCIIRFFDSSASLHLTHKIVNYWGGSATAEDFEAYVIGIDNPSFSFFPIFTNNMAVVEPIPYGRYFVYVDHKVKDYETFFSGDCSEYHSSAAFFATSTPSFTGTTEVDASKTNNCVLTHVYNPNNSGNILIKKTVLDRNGAVLPNATVNDRLTLILKNLTDNSLQEFEFNTYPRYIEVEKLNSYEVIEKEQDGYVNKGCTALAGGITNTTPVVNLTPYSSYVVNCVNQIIPPILKVEKENNSSKTGVYVGDTVTYTITISAPSDGKEGNYILKNTILNDKTPQGFSFVSGSWKMRSSLRGNLNNNPTKEPLYNGVDWSLWNLGDIREGETITLTYLAKISSVPGPGLYKDISWVSGETLDGGEVLGNKSISGGTEFVESEVMVLGISVLPNTGSNSLLTLLSLFLILCAGLFLTPSSRKSTTRNML